MYGNARVFGNAWVSMDALVYGYAWVTGDAYVRGDAYVSGDARVSGCPIVWSDTRDNVKRSVCVDPEYVPVPWDGTMEQLAVELAGSGSFRSRKDLDIAVSVLV